LADEWCRAWAELPSPEATDELRRELAEARRALAEMWSAAWLLMWRAIGDSISADDWCNEWARCPSPEAFAEVTRERDALKAGKWAGAWRWDDTGEWCSRHRPNEDVHTVELAMRGTGFMWRFRFEAGEQAGSLDAAKAAADAHLIAAGWFLAGGPHGAGEAK
jgi:hypothetical protein